jgi:hypothetical protein
MGVLFHSAISQPASQPGESGGGGWLAGGGRCGGAWAIRQHRTHTNLPPGDNVA